jgi:predicted transposase YbfD/YdcC
MENSCKEKQLSVKEILDTTSGKLIEESIKVCKAELIKTNTTLETLKHNFDNFEHDSIDTILNIEYKNSAKLKQENTRIFRDNRSHVPKQYKQHAD